MLAEGVSSQHIEIMRGDLAKIIYELARENVEYVFDDSVATLQQSGTEVQVTFERNAPRTFELVVGADGLHSTTRRLVFGAEHEFLRFLGGYLAVFTVPNYLNLTDRMMASARPGRTAALYPVGDGCRGPRRSVVANANSTRLRPTQCQLGTPTTAESLRRLRVGAAAAAERTRTIRRPLPGLDQPGRDAHVDQRTSRVGRRRRVLTRTGGRRRNQPGHHRCLHTGQRVGRCTWGPHSRISGLRTRTQARCSAQPLDRTHGDQADHPPISGPDLDYGTGHARASASSDFPAATDHLVRRQRCRNAERGPTPATARFAAPRLSAVGNLFDLHLQVITWRRPKPHWDSDSLSIV